MNKLSALLASLALLVLPALFVFQIKQGQVWQDRLALPILEYQPSRHTPHFTEGTYLPPRITKSMTLTKNQSPVLLNNSTTIAPGAELVIEAGTTLYAGEFASLVVEGKLIIRGQDKDPVLITTNELHPLNQFWNGIMIQKNGTAKIEYTRLEYASPGISCLKDSSAVLKNVRITHTTVPLFNQSPNCSLQ